MKVYLVGAGPGDPGLITVKGRKVLEQADSILYDHLANERLLDLAPAHAERVYVGKKRSAHAVSQEEIDAMFPAHWDPKLRIPRGQVVAAASIVSPKY